MTAPEGECPHNLTMATHPGKATPDVSGVATTQETPPLPHRPQHSATPAGQPEETPHTDHAKLLSPLSTWGCDRASTQPDPPPPNWPGLEPQTSHPPRGISSSPVRADDRTGCYSRRVPVHSSPALITHRLPPLTNNSGTSLPTFTAPRFAICGK